MHGKLQWLLGMLKPTKSALTDSQTSFSIGFTVLEVPRVTSLTMICALVNSFPQRYGELSGNIPLTALAGRVNCGEKAPNGQVASPAVSQRYCSRQHSYLSWHRNHRQHHPLSSDRAELTAELLHAFILGPRRLAIHCSDVVDSWGLTVVSNADMDGSLL